MGTIVLESPDVDVELSPSPPDFGKCPVCSKPLYPKDRMTGQPRKPSIGTGYNSRAKCGGCGTVLVYLGNKNWRPLVDSDLSEEDDTADKFDSLFK